MTVFSRSLEERPAVCFAPKGRRSVVRLILLGAPGAGKGTQADLLKEKYACIHVSTGDILRQNLKDRTELGIKAEIFMNRGELVPDDLVVGMVADRLREKDATGGFLMDGFPRTLSQAEAFDDILKEIDAPLDGVLLLEIDEEMLVRRLVNRRSCRSCGRIWNLLTMASDAKTCPDCNGELYRRDDDTEDVIRNRLRIYRVQTAPLISWYKNRGILHDIDASGSREETFSKIQAVLDRV